MEPKDMSGKMSQLQKTNTVCFLSQGETKNSVDLNVEEGLE